MIKKDIFLQDSMEGGVWNMVEEMIREIRTAEKQADEIVKEAREKSAEIAQQTEEEARRIEKEITEKAGQTAKAPGPSGRRKGPAERGRGRRCPGKGDPGTESFFFGEEKRRGVGSCNFPCLYRSEKESRQRRMIQWRYLRCRGLTVCALKKDRKAILEKLQSMGVLQVDPVSGDDRGLQENGYSRAEDGI